MIIRNKEGRRFLVRIVKKGERYGLNDCLVHEDKVGLPADKDPLIEFYDLTHANEKGFGERGQFVSRYYASTLVEHTVGEGLDLCGHEPVWKIDGEALAPVIVLARMAVLVLAHMVTS